MDTLRKIEEFCNKYVFPSLILFFLAATVFVSVPLVKKSVNVKSSHASSVAGLSLKMSPSMIGTIPGESFDINLVLNTQSQQVSATDMTITYDPALIQVQSLSIGTFLPVTLMQTLSSGTIRLVLGCNPGAPVSGEGTLATIKVKTLAAGATTINYTESTQVAVVNNSTNALSDRQSATFNISSPTNTITATPIPTTIVATSTPIPTIVKPTSTPTPTSIVPSLTPTPIVYQQSRLDVYAAGNPASGIYPHMQVYVSGKLVIDEFVTGNPNWRIFNKYSYPFDTKIDHSQVVIKYVNDGWNKTENRDLRIDKIVIDGTTYQSESSSVYSTGTWKNNNCNPGYRRSEWLQCNGYFQY